MGRSAVLALLVLALSAPVAGADSYLYSANLGGASISQFDIATPGALAPKSPASVDGQGWFADVAVSRDGRAAYLANEIGGSVWQYGVGPGS